MSVQIAVAVVDASEAAGVELVPIGPVELKGVSSILTLHAARRSANPA